jgi:hypothetical protein
MLKIHNLRKTINTMNKLKGIDEFLCISFKNMEIKNSEAPEEDTDISGKNITEEYNNSLTKKWIKLISKNMVTPYDSYNRKEYFKHVAHVVLDEDKYESGSKEGEKKRQNLIKFDPTVDDFNEKVEWIYIFTINDHIVKIGGTRTGLKGRVISYLCGHHTPERGKSGDCSKTNGFIYNTFVFYLQQHCKIDMYGYKLPLAELHIDIFDKQVKIISQTYHAYETTFLEDYKKMYKHYPILCDNCDPNYKP